MNLAYLKPFSPTDPFPLGKSNDPPPIQHDLWLRYKCDLGLGTIVKNCTGKRSIISRMNYNNYPCYTRKSQEKLCIDLQVLDKELKYQSGSCRIGCYGEASSETLFNMLLQDEALMVCWVGWFWCEPSAGPCCPARKATDSKKTHKEKWQKLRLAETYLRAYRITWSRRAASKPEW